MGHTTVNFYFDVVYFSYGLAFVLLGMVVVVRHKGESRFELAHFIWLLAGFALSHGILEWMYLWEVVRGDDYPVLDLARPGCLFLSYIFLFEFGRCLVFHSLPPTASPSWRRLWLSRPMLLAMLAGILLAVAVADQKIVALEIWSRYLLGFTGSMLTGFGFYAYCERQIRPAIFVNNFPPIRNACHWAGLSFLAYGILAGLVVPHSDGFPAAWLNQEQFREVSGIPVQILRAGCAVLITLSVTQLLWVFHIETQQRLIHSLTQTEQALNEIHQLRHRDELILHSVAEGICGFDMEGRIIFINPSALDMLGYTQAELLGQQFDASVAERRGDRLSSDEPGVIQKVLNDGKIHRGEVSILHRKDGSSFPVEFRAAPINDAGKLTGAVVTFQDITERKQVQDDLDAQNKTLNAITTSTENAIVMNDNHGNISFWNKGAETMFGYAADEAIGQNLHELIAPAKFLHAHREAFPHWQKTGTGNAIGKTLELVGMRKDGQSFPIELSLSSVFLRQRWHAVGIVRDITERKQAEEVLSQAKQAAESANRAKSEFLANMSHEIRTPMNAILGLIQLILDTPLTPKQDDFLRKAHASSRALLNILNDILDYSKIEAGRLEIFRMPFRVEGPLKDVADLHAAQMAEKGLELFIEIDHDVPQAVIGDAMRLTQVLNNLVGNAVKFTEHGEIHVKAELANVAEDLITLRFSVRDTGIGLAKVQMDRLFQAFTQGDSSITRKYGGTGLGLTICQRLVRLMGGEIAVSSTEGEGATFSFTVQVGLTSESPSHHDPQQLGHSKILAVDDQETARIILKQMLDAWGLESHTAASGQEALTLMAEAERNRCPFNAVLLDWRMPGMSGLDVAQKLQQGAEQGRLTHPLLVVMITAYDKEELLAQAGSIHLDGILTKPVTPSDLFDALLNRRNRQPANPAIRQGTNTNPPNFNGAHVLLVEDNPINQEVAAELLKKRNLTVTLANHGGEALDRVAKESFDAVFMDLHMPIMGGLEATQRIHEHPAAQSLPIIAMTAAVMPEDRERCAACGMVDFVSKPIDPEELDHVLLRWIKPRGGNLSPDVVEQPSAPPASQYPLPDTLPGFEIHPAIHRLGGNHALLARLLLNFAEGHGETQQRLDDFLATGQTNQAATLLHSLKGEASNLGSMKLARWAAQLEQEIKAGEPLSSQQAFADALAGSIESIAKHIPRHRREPTAEGLNREDLTNLLQRLSPYLRESEVVPSEHILELNRLAHNDLPGFPLAKLIRQIDQFDFAGALATINELDSAIRVEIAA